MPMPSAAPTRAHQGWTARTSRTSRRMGYGGGLANWRLLSGKKLTNRTPSEECSYPRPTANSGRWASPQPHRTALQSRQPLGSAEVTHPFHPLCGHRFVVLKVRRVSGVETLSLRHADLGSFALPREWTDWAPPGTQTALTGVQPLLVDAFGLLGLAELATRLTRNDGA